MHNNSLLAYSSILPTLSERQRPIVELLLQYAGIAFTDRQIKNELRLDDMNSVRPRITELCADNILEEVDQVYCNTTGRLVRRVRLREFV